MFSRHDYNNFKKFVWNWAKNERALAVQTDENLMNNKIQNKDFK